MPAITQTRMENVMRAIRVEKITLNIGTGGPGDALEKALKLLEKIAQAKPVTTKTKKRIPTWGVRPGLEIGAKITVRGKKADEILSRLLKAKDNTLPTSAFDHLGNFSFGIAEYIDVPGVIYDASIGIIGFEVAVTLMRPGFRVRRRPRNNKSIPKRHSISQEEAIAFMQERFGTKVKS